MINKGNTKLGAGIFTWSLPAYLTCPGATPVCLSCCYALSKRFKKGVVLDAHMRNLQLCYEPDFVRTMIQSINSRLCPVVRVHVAGDFFSAEYTEQWHQIADLCPGTQFFAYTRSWRDEDMLLELISLSAAPNFELWWSVDMGTGDPPIVPGIRSAYMAINDIDASRTPAYCDLTFRDNRGTIMKKANGVQVCPKESGLPHATKHVNCTMCKICWTPGRNSFSDVALAARNEEFEEFTEILAPEREYKQQPEEALNAYGG